MEILEKTDWVFRDPVTKESHPVIVSLTNVIALEKGCLYLIGNYVYKCIGKIQSIKDVQQGHIVCINGNWKIEPYMDNGLKHRFSENNIITKEEYEKELNVSNNFDEIVSEYIADYEQGKNLMIRMSTNTSSGDVFLPELTPDDDPFEKVIKSMLLHLKVVLNDYKHNVDKPHIVDNLRSALSGATKNMSITKFLLWCKVLQLDWEISVFNVDDTVEHPINTINVSNYNDSWQIISPAEDKSIFVVPLVEGEDPLKRIIKLALYQKQINTKDCEDKSSSAHLINNMKSALKNKQKMTMTYFMSWCELLDIMFEIKVIEPKTGVYYQVIGYDLYTNAEEVEPDNEGTNYE